MADDGSDNELEFLSGDDYPQPSNETVSLLGRNAALLGVLSTLVAYQMGAPDDAGFLADAVLLGGAGAYLAQVAFMFLYPELCREEGVMQLSTFANAYDLGPYLLYTGAAALVLAGLNVLFALL